MKFWSRLKSTFRNLFRKPYVENQLDEELRAYVDLIADEQIAEGMPAPEALRIAKAESGGIEQIKQSVRDHRAGTVLELWWQDVRFGLRQLRKNPGFTLSAVAALALGIGANTAIFSVVNTVLLKPLGYPHPDRMVKFLAPSEEIANDLHNIPEFHFFQQQTNLFKEVVAFDNVGPGFNLTGGSHPEQVNGIHVTEGYFRMYGAPMALGRTFTPQEDLPHGGKVVVLSYGLWQRRFSGDKNIVGKSISLGNQPYTVVGVTGKDFVGDVRADIWLPFQFAPDSTDMNVCYFVTGLLQPGVSVLQANAALAVATPEFLREYPNAWIPRFRVGPLFDSIIGDARNSLLLMLGAVGLVLLIACANVANLLLVRATIRKREFAIRSALGAGRMRIMRQLLTESLMLSLAGGVFGMMLGFVGMRALLAVSPAGLPRIGEHGSAVGIDWRVLGFTLAVSLLTGILFGVFPAFSASRSDLNSALKQSDNRSGTGFRQGAARSFLVVSEISLALVLLIGSALLIRTFIALHNVSPGFDAHNVLTMEMSLNGPRYQKTAGLAQLLRDGRTHLNALPGVEIAAAGFWIPIDVEDATGGFHIAGRPVKKDCCGSKWMSITPGYLSLLNIPVLSGRAFNDNDTADAPSVALINEAFARKFFPNQNPIGQKIDHGQTGAQRGIQTIVGVIADFHDGGLTRPATPMMILPIDQVTDDYNAAYADVQPIFWFVRTHDDPHQYIEAIARQLRFVSHGFPVAHIRTLDEVMGSSTARQSFNMLLLTIFGAVALFLAAIGIYGLMAYSVAQRTQEMGIRIALGADRSVIRNFVVRQGMRLAFVGVAAGIAASFGLTRLLSIFLFGVTPWDPIVFIAAPIILTAIALLAVWIPATRASKVNPMQALRAE
ncbi:MAG TPA: ABC transporter permease [Terracidiphilus sp.]|nr:ABC transporter permease [Terracidiphilus sp.]